MHTLHHFQFTPTRTNFTPRRNSISFKENRQNTIHLPSGQVPYDTQLRRMKVPDTYQDKSNTPLAVSQFEDICVSPSVSHLRVCVCLPFSWCLSPFRRLSRALSFSLSHDLPFFVHLILLAAILIFDVQECLLSLNQRQQPITSHRLETTNEFSIATEKYQPVFGMLFDATNALL